jgi:hypothetical protein
VSLSKVATCKDCKAFLFIPQDRDKVKLLIHCRILVILRIFGIKLHQHVFSIIFIDQTEPSFAARNTDRDVIWCKQLFGTIDRSNFFVFATVSTSFLKTVYKGTRPIDLNFRDVDVCVILVPVCDKVSIPNSVEINRVNVNSNFDLLLLQPGMAWQVLESTDVLLLYRIVLVW